MDPQKVALIALVIILIFIVLYYIDSSTYNTRGQTSVVVPSGRTVIREVETFADAEVLTSTAPLTIPASPSGSSSSGSGFVRTANAQCKIAKLDLDSRTPSKYVIESFKHEITTVTISSYINNFCDVKSGQQSSFELLDASGAMPGRRLETARDTPGSPVCFQMAFEEPIGTFEANIMGVIAFKEEFEMFASLLAYDDQGEIIHQETIESMKTSTVMSIRVCDTFNRIAYIRISMGNPGHCKAGLVRIAMNSIAYGVCEDASTFVTRTITADGVISVVYTDDATGDVIDDIDLINQMKLVSTL